MATLVLSAAGAAIGGAVGGSILGISAAAIGQAVGASIGGAIDQGIFGPGDQTVSRGQIESFRLQSSVEGTPIPRLAGRTRVAGQLIWTSDFIESVSNSSSGGGGKFNSQPTITTQNYSYSISLAVALCEGEIVKVGRIWADGEELDRSNLTMRVYSGSNTQVPDDKIVAIEGIENVPAFRGVAYVVFENLQLEQFGNRVPQLNFEVFRRAQPADAEKDSINDLIEAVALIPGSGEYSLATTPVNYKGDFGANQSANVHTNRGKTDFTHAIEDLRSDLPNCSSVSMVVSWFGDDLRCSECTLRPKVEHHDLDGDEMPWRVSGVGRVSASQVSRVDDRPVFGGTPSDQSVIEAISHLRSGGQDVVFYPFILMDIMQGNGLEDPYGWNDEQPSIPWRGRITTSIAPDRVGSPDKTTLVNDEVNAFFGTAAVEDFAVSGGVVSYSGPAEWSYRRFILHNAFLCLAAGGVDAFCVGSELRGLTQLRSDSETFPVVQKLIELASDVRSVLGGQTKIGYAADWSEYFGYHPADGSGDLLYHLDDLWAHSDVDFIGVDNYMPLSDWRDAPEHLDSDAGQIYNLDYLKANIEGGEGYDWYYANEFDRKAQKRSVISDGAYDEPWVYRYKDLRNWWGRYHFNRVGGQKVDAATNWQPESKPFWFTELGFPAVDKATNQPNVFVDPKSSESQLPYFSTGDHDPQVQSTAIRAVLEYWSDGDNNPVSSQYSGQMIDVSRTHIWAWDARPWPDFPSRTNVWSDGDNFTLGHWISGRMGGTGLAELVAEICEYAGVHDFDVSDLNSIVTGFRISNSETARTSLQTLMTGYEFNCVESEGVLVFRRLSDDIVEDLESDNFVVEEQNLQAFEVSRISSVALPDRFGLKFWDPNHDYQLSEVEARRGEINSPTISNLDLPLVLTNTEASGIARRLLKDRTANQEVIKFTLPASQTKVSVGDIVAVKGRLSGGRYRIGSIEELGIRMVEASRVELEKTLAASVPSISNVLADVIPSNPVYSVFLDLPLLKENHVAVAPYVAITGEPWPNRAAVYSSASDAGYELDYFTNNRAIFAKTKTALIRSEAHRWSNVSFEVELSSGSLYSISDLALFDGGNSAAIRLPNSDTWEIIQFRNAVLNPDGSYTLSKLLRGQLGTDAFMPDLYPAGCELVILNSGIGQLPIVASGLGIARNYLVGPARYPYSDSSFTAFEFTPEGIGLRPFSPSHLVAEVSLNGDVELTWVRRSRATGDYWNGVDIPIMEAFEKYLIEIRHAGSVVGSYESNSENFTYTFDQQSIDEVSGEVEIEVSQVSEIFGPGPVTRTTMNV